MIRVLPLCRCGNGIVAGRVSRDVLQDRQHDAERPGQPPEREAFDWVSHGQIATVCYADFFDFMGSVGCWPADTNSRSSAFANSAISGAF